MPPSRILSDPRLDCRPHACHLGRPAANRAAILRPPNSRQRTVGEGRSAVPAGATTDRLNDIAAIDELRATVVVGGCCCGRRRIPKPVPKQEKIVQECAFSKALEARAIRSHIRVQHGDEPGLANQERRQSDLPPEAASKLAVTQCPPFKSAGALHHELRGQRADAAFGRRQAGAKHVIYRSQADGYPVIHE